MTFKNGDSYSIDKVVQRSNDAFDVYVSYSIGKKKQKKIRKFNKKLAELKKLLKEIEEL